MTWCFKHATMSLPAGVSAPPSLDRRYARYERCYSDLSGACRPALCTVATCLAAQALYGGKRQDVAGFETCGENRCLDANSFRRPEKLVKSNHRPLERAVFFDSPISEPAEAGLVYRTQMRKSISVSSKTSSIMGRTSSQLRRSSPQPIRGMATFVIPLSLQTSFMSSRAVLRSFRVGL